MCVGRSEVPENGDPLWSLLIKSKSVNSPMLVITPILDFLLFSSARWVFFLLFYQVFTKNKLPIRFDAAAFSNIIMLQSSAIDTVAQSSAIVSTYHKLAELWLNTSIKRMCRYHSLCRPIYRSLCLVWLVSRSRAGKMFGFQRISIVKKNIRPLCGILAWNFTENKLSTF